MTAPDFDKNPLLPAIVQDARSGAVLMLGYMNAVAYQQSVEQGRVVFFSRKSQQLWVKGQTSGNYLQLVSISVDCDRDAILVRAVPAGPTCHTGTVSCFQDAPLGGQLAELEQTIELRRKAPTPGSYTAQLFKSGLARIAQKVGEEATECVIAALQRDPAAIRNESADLLYHLLVLMSASNVTLAEVLEVLRTRNATAGSRKSA